MEKTYLETLGTWFFGLSNLLLSVVALWLANRKLTLEPNLSGSSADCCLSVTQYDHSQSLVFNLVNRSPYSIKINSIMLIFNKRKSGFAIIPHDDQLPTTIEPGINKSIDVNLERFSNNFPKIHEISAKEIGKMEVKIGTSLGPVLINLEPSFKQAISRIISKNGV
jgi:hypothetical protein